MVQIFLNRIIAFFKAYYRWVLTKYVLIYYLAVTILTHFTYEKEIVAQLSQNVHVFILLAHGLANSISYLILSLILTLPLSVVIDSFKIHKKYKSQVDDEIADFRGKIEEQRRNHIERKNDE